MFEMLGRRVKFELALPDKSEFRATPSGRRQRSVEQMLSAYEQSVRQRWRALALVIKAKLEAVESNISVFEEEFLAHIVMPNGQTVGQWMLPQIETAYATKKMPRVLGHTWQSDGGRACPRGSDNCSQAVYRCARCGEYDYGEPGGPGHQDCSEPRRCDGTLEDEE